MLTNLKELELADLKDPELEAFNKLYQHRLKIAVLAARLLYVWNETTWDEYLGHHPRKIP